MYYSIIYLLEHVMIYCLESVYLYKYRKMCVYIYTYECVHISEDIYIPYNIYIYIIDIREQSHSCR